MTQGEVKMLMELLQRYGNVIKEPAPEFANVLGCLAAQIGIHGIDGADQTSGVDEDMYNASYKLMYALNSVVQASQFSREVTIQQELKGLTGGE